MLLALSLASGSALLGGALALAVRRRRALLELTRTFAFAAAAGVVALHLLPEALGAIGVRGLLWAALGFAVPGLLEWRARSLGPGLRARGLSPARVAAELGFLALVAHSLLEGVALSAAAGGSGSQADLEIALVAHHAPLTAAVILPFLELVDARGVAIRVLGVALAGALGAVAGSMAPSSLTAGLPQSIASAVMAGALLHVVADEIQRQQFERAWERGADLLAALIGAGIAVVSAVFGGSGPGPYAAAFLVLVLPCAPALLAADLLMALPSRPGRSLAQRPELDALLVTLRALGLLAALAQLLLATLGWLLGSAFAPGEGRPARAQPGFLARLLGGTARSAPRRLLAFQLGAIALSILPRALDVPDLVGACAAGLGFLALAALSAGAAGAIAAAFLALLLPWAPGAAQLVPALALGPLLLRREAFRGEPRRRITGALLLGLLFASAALLLDRPLFEERARAAALSLPLLAGQPLLELIRRAPVEYGAGAVLLALGLVSLWRSGARGFLAPLLGPDA